MDVNNTKYWQLLTEADWGLDQTSPARDGNLTWDPKDAVVRLESKLFRFPTPPGAAGLSPEARRGAAADRFGNWYWIGESGTGLKFRNPAGEAQDFWTGWELPACPPEAGSFVPLEVTTPGPVQLSGLCVTRTHYLVAGTLAPAGLLVFDLHAGGPPTQLLWPETISFRPLDLSSTDEGGLWILDAAEGARLWLLDRTFSLAPLDQTPVSEAVPPADFEPAVGAGETGTPPPWSGTLDRSLALNLTLDHPVSIEALGDDEVLVLDSDTERGYSLVHRYRCAELAGEAPLDRGLFDRFLGAGSEWESEVLLAHDLAYRQTSDGGRLYLVAADGNQAFEFLYTSNDETFQLALEPRYWPLSRFGGRALVAHADEVFYDQDQRWVPLVAYRRPRFREQGDLESGILDSGLHDCRWHRLLLDAVVPPDTSVLFESRANNDPSLLEQLPWRPEPRPYLRSGGAEIPFHAPFAGYDCDGAGTWETLLQGALGRYLQLRITLVGNGRVTPRLRALRLYYPRFSYLEAYLPAIYREDPTSASFLERFLANAEGLFTGWEDRVAQAQVLFDARSTPADYLPWLADWLGLAQEADWEEWRTRWLLEHAMTLFRQRGTVPGLLRAIRLATDPCHDPELFEPRGLDPPQPVRLVEDFLRRRAPGVVFGDPTDAPGLGVTRTAGTWDPALGAAPLHQSYRDFLQQRYGSIDALNSAWDEADYSAFDQLGLPPIQPCGPARAADWRAFLAEGIGITYADVTGADQPIYQRFLRHRYRSLAAYSVHYGPTAASDFAAVSLPTELPAGGVPLQDWIQFVSVLLPRVRHAHRFTVLVPAQWNEREGGHGELVGRVRRVLEIERPAHTQYDIRTYWALFRVGEVRLGLDTLIGEGARLSALALGQGYLGQSYLTPAHPVSNRPVPPLACDR